MSNGTKWKSKISKKWIIIILVFLMVWSVPVFLANEYVCFNPITRTVFKISTDDPVSIILDGGTESWYVELTGEEREKAIEIINNIRYYFWLPSHQLFFSTGGWEQCFRIKTSNRYDMYVISDNRIEVGYLTVFGYTKEMMDLIDRYRLKQE